MKNIGLFLLGCMAMSLASAQSLRFEQNTLFVKLNDGETLPSHSLITNSKLLFGTLYEITTEDAVLLENDLRTDPAVAWTEKSFYAGAREIALPGQTAKAYKSINGFNDPQANRVWAFRDSAQHGVSIDKAYANLPNRAARQIVVAVVDTGVDYRHEDLKDVMWVNKKEVPGNGIDDDNNGYIDDVNGINTIERNADGTASHDPQDPHSHGTHVSGTIGAAQNNGKGIAGIASNVRIMAIRTVPSKGDETDRNVAESYLYAAKNGARLINCSFGKEVNEGGMVVSETIKHIGERYNTLVIAASGNDSWGTVGRWFDIDTNLRYPASFDNAHLLVIAATSSDGKMASFSNIGKVSVDVAAPGENVHSTTPNNGYRSMSGTSMAAPTTTGVAAQVLSYFPGLTALELKEVMMNSVTKVPSFANRIVTGGRIDLVAALEYAGTKFAHRTTRR